MSTSSSLSDGSSTRKIPSLPDGYILRSLEENDFNNNLIPVLKTLTTVGDVTKEEFANLYSEWIANSHVYNPLVITNREGKVVASGMLIVESKLIHKCGKVGHIEDIAVDLSEQGKKLGLILIKNLVELARLKNCYKVILDCDAKNTGFYEKCGFSQEGIEMGFRF
ncbi:hypothetical protein PACTADRAFT_40804 [Pachysolen tannophilus NRRL Y-2460]|uniref:Glucosamine 6-phosphate N-acetyltransferase n=1 Tax=Pachysolen tannophilus NRRL Y-2460 TaxID=669874 RepID=A0A1E4TWD6_PACTA|nr:hypothetical protein PACTADRAFT_40804 [Pachysolen tannophilus NRRL Y-2460]